jgi:hypothetical protein
MVLTNTAGDCLYINKPAILRKTVSYPKSVFKPKYQDHKSGPALPSFGICEGKNTGVKDNI